MTEINSIALDKLLEKILNSAEFCNSHIYGKYLTYLVTSSREDKNLKETTIAIEFFEKDAAFNPAEDTIVRSHTYNLRKKLEKYYFTEGKTDKYRIKIPKGHYQVDINANKETFLSREYYFEHLKKYYQLWIIGILIVGLLALMFKIFSLQNQLALHRFVEADDYIWKEYLQSELPVMVVPGDHFMFNMYSEKYQRELSIRDVTVNSREDLDSLKKQYGDISLQQTAEPYFPYHSIWSIPPVYTVLLSANQNPILRKSSSISPQMLGEYNIIFIGSIKTLYALRHTISKSHFDYQIAPHKVYYNPPDGSARQEFSTKLHSSGPNEDLILVLKLPGPNKNVIMLIASYHSLGAPEIANYLMDQENREELDALLVHDDGTYPRYFEILFKVVGIDKTAYNREILVCNEIKSE